MALARSRSSASAVAERLAYVISRGELQYAAEGEQARTQMDLIQSHYIKAEPEDQARPLG